MSDDVELVSADAPSPVVRFLDTVWRSGLSLFRFVFGYVTFVAAVISAITLITKRKILEAVLDFLSDITAIEEIISSARAIASFWNANVIYPVHFWIVDRFALDLPVWVVELSSLVLFSLGPTLRFYWSVRTEKRNIFVRRAAYESLRSIIETQKQQANSLKKALEQRNSGKLNALGKMLAGATMGGLAALTGDTRSITHSLAMITKAYEFIASGAKNWQQIENRIDYIKRSTAELEKAAEEIGEKDGGLLKDLSGVRDELASREIRSYVRRKMRISRIISHISIGLALSVWLAYVVDWVVFRAVAV
ncbi:hypothetical protein [Stakelama tenebrarum]|uniref:Uncharacterized protein n=1 Tax=Stakelama tenebrarum TaxID=2711215 RepID=A0A6G6Y504_9SPHN|nr:hypothetical protein [Sphingosinithalassobacter tenebrarum]QIG80012.1 hypothetical protein G5C33_09630 [Sphingosinithalassobacter tenebrarum]